MPDENDLRDFFATADAPNTLDAQRVIARSRRRRIPRQFAAGAVGVLALAGVGVLAVNVTTLQPTSVMLSDGATLSEESSDVQPQKRTGAAELQTCGAPLALSEPSRYGLELTVDFPETSDIASGTVDGVVRMTNTSSDTVLGMTALAPSLALSQAGIVVWTSDPVQFSAGTAVGLAPGQSLEYTASFEPVRCAAADSDPTFQSGRALGPGSYELSAAIDFMPQHPAEELAVADLVTGPSSTIRLE